MKKINLYLKEPHLKIIKDLKKKLSIASDKKIVNKLILSGLNLKKNECIFTIRKEKCRGGCYASKPRFEIDINENILKQLKKIYISCGFDDYKTEEESISKVIRCIINFFEDDIELITL